MNLYHYTSCYHLNQILKDKVIKTAPSNLLKPVNPQIKNGSLIDDATDDYKPVVWFTTVSDFNTAIQAGLNKWKTEVAIIIEAPILQNFMKWETWAINNKIDEQWFATLKETAPIWATFYISENPVTITDDIKIVFRPDVYEALQNE